MNKKYLPLFLAEFVGTFFLVLFGCGAMILADSGITPISGLGIAVAFGGIVAVMIYSVGHISGAHFNPAVTIAFISIKRFPLNRLLGYLIAQFSGAIAASFVHSLVFSGKNHAFGATHFTMGIAGGFAVEFILTFCLMFVITAVATDSRAVGELAGLAIGTTVALCALVFGPLTNASMNPARTLGPALFEGRFDQVWVYFVAPILGAIFGALTYNWIKCQKEENTDFGCC